MVDSIPNCRANMRFRFMNQMQKSLYSTGAVSCSSPTTSLSSVLGSIKSSQTLCMQQKSGSCSRQRLAFLQKRLSSDNTTVRIARVALGVELCSAVSSILLDIAAVDQNLPRGWDAGVDVDDDGG